MVAQPETSSTFENGSFATPEVGHVLTISAPERKDAATANLLNYAIYGVAAITLFAASVIATGKTAVGEDSFGQIAMMLTPITMIVVLVGFWSMRRTLRIERALQERFMSALNSRLGLHPMEYTDILQKPDSLFLTDGETITVWDIAYTSEAITLTRVRPSGS